MVDLRAAARMLRDALKDKSYRSTPLGLEVARYIRWKRSEWGASPETITTYEPILARLAVFFADLELRDFEPPVGVERLRECLDFHWGEREPATRGKVIACWRDFFGWACDERGMIGNPGLRLKMPKKRGVRREPFAKSFVDTVIAGQSYLGDRLGVMLVLKYALRRAELCGVRFRDFDLTRGQLILKGKGGKVRVIPIVEDWFWVEFSVLRNDLGGDAARDLFPVCQRRKVGMRTTYFHTKGLQQRAMDRWWYDRLVEAGVAEEGERGLGMHRGRHTVASEILRGSGNIVAASEMLGHESIETTRQAYASFDTNDLAAVLRALRAESE